MIDFQGKKALVMGLGLYPKGSGISAVKFLLAKNAKVIVTDLRTKKELSPQITRLRKVKNSKNIKYVLGRHRAEDFEWADLVVKNPGVPKDSEYLKISKQRKIPVFNDLTLFLQEFKGDVIGVTGTRGKSTVVSLAYEIFKKAGGKKVFLGGNIKISPLNYIGKIKDEDTLILEVSSWQANGFNDMKYSPQIAVVLNVMNDHLNMYKNFKEYLIDKTYLYKFQNPDDCVVLNKDNASTRKMGEEVTSQRFWISKTYFIEENGAYIKDGYFWWRDWGKETPVCPVKSVKLIGEHNLYNVLAAIAVAKLKGISNEKIRKAVESFTGIDSRLEFIGKFKGVEFYNDTCSTTPDAAMAALESFKQKVVLIAGGEDKDLDYGELAGHLNRKTKSLILFPGTATDKLTNSKDFNVKEYALANNMQEAVETAFDQAKPGDVILLSPAATSFGLFKNEFDRGSQFNQVVRKLR